MACNALAAAEDRLCRRHSLPAPMRRSSVSMPTWQYDPAPDLGAAYAHVSSSGSRAEADRTPTSARCSARTVQHTVRREPTRPDSRRVEVVTAGIQRLSQTN